MANNLGINIKIGADLKNFSKDMQNAARQMKRTGMKMQSIGKSLSKTLTLPLGLAGAAMIKFASDTEESLNKVDVAFGDSSKLVKDFADTTLKSFGIARGSALEMASTFGDMATSMGIGQDAAASMSTKLVGLAGDLASFKNIRIDIAQTALNSIFTGETESLKKLGIVMTQANLSAFALEKGITKPIKEMSEGEKVMLRYNFVMEKTANAHGDFERTGGGAANQMRIFQESLKQLAEQFGKVILPAFTKLVQKINGVVSWFSSLDDSTRNTILVIGGLVAAAGPLLMIIGQINIGVAALIPTLAKMGIAITGSLGPIGLLIAGVSLLGYAIYDLTRKDNDLTETMKKKYSVMNAEYHLRKESAKSIANEKSEIQSLLSIARDEYKSKEQRLEAIKKLNTISPEYIKGITLENVGTKEVTASIDNYISSLNKKARAQAASNLLTQQYQEQLNVLKELAAVEENYNRNKNTPVAVSKEDTPASIEAKQVAKNAIVQFEENQIARLKQKSSLIQKNIDLLIKEGGVFQKNDANQKNDFTINAPEIDVEEPIKGLEQLERAGHNTKESLIAAFRALNPAWEMAKEGALEMSKSIGYSLQEMTSGANEALIQSGDGWTQFTKSMSNALDDAQMMLNNFIADTFTGFLDALGQEVGGSTKAIDRWGAGLLESFGKFLGELGGMVIAYGASLLAVKRSKNPIAIIAAGAALVVIGGFIKQKVKSAGSAMTGGDTGGADVPTAPSYTSGSAGYMNNSSGLVLETVIYGSDIVLSSNRQHGTIQRTRG